MEEMTPEEIREELHKLNERIRKIESQFKAAIALSEAVDEVEANLSGGGRGRMDKACYRMIQANEQFKKELEK